MNYNTPEFEQAVINVIENNLEQIYGKIAEKLVDEMNNSQIDDEQVLRAISNLLDKMADDIAGEIAAKLQKTFEEMPASSFPAECKITISTEPPKEEDYFFFKDQKELDKYIEQEGKQFIADLHSQDPDCKEELAKKIKQIFTSPPTAKE